MGTMVPDLNALRILRDPRNSPCRRACNLFPSLTEQPVFLHPRKQPRTTAGLRAGPLSLLGDDRLRRECYSLVMIRPLSVEITPELIPSSFPNLKSLTPSTTPIMHTKKCGLPLDWT